MRRGYGYLTSATESSRHSLYHSNCSFSKHHIALTLKGLECQESTWHGVAIAWPRRFRQGLPCQRSGAAQWAKKKGGVVAVTSCCCAKDGVPGLLCRAWTWVSPKALYSLTVLTEQAPWKSNLSQSNCEVPRYDCSTRVWFSSVPSATAILWGIGTGRAFDVRMPQEMGCECGCIIGEPLVKPSFKASGWLRLLLLWFAKSLLGSILKYWAGDHCILGSRSGSQGSTPTLQCYRWFSD